MNKVYYLLNKPIGCVTSVSADMDRLTVNAYTKNQNLNGQGQAYNTNPYVRLSMINVMEDGGCRHGNLS